MHVIHFKLLGGRGVDEFRVTSPHGVDMIRDDMG